MLAFTARYESVIYIYIKVLGQTDKRGENARQKVKS